MAGGCGTAAALSLSGDPPDIRWLPKVVAAPARRQTGALRAALDCSTDMVGGMMIETIGRLLAAGQRAEVFEWGSRVVKLYRSAGSRRVAFREAAIHAAVEALGLPVPSVWSVQQIGGHWGIVFDRVSG